MSAFRAIHRAFSDFRSYVAAAALGTAVSFAGISPQPMDDHFLYQAFIEAAASGRIDFSIIGFHGASFLAVPLHWVTGSALSNIEFQTLCALMLVPLAFAAARGSVSRTEATLFACAMALSPFFFFVAYRGFTGPSYVMLFFLTLIGIRKGARWAWLPWGIAMTIKPFAFALLPLFFFWSPHKNAKRAAIAVLAGLAVPMLYVCAQFLQTGTLSVGAHHDLSVANVFHWQRIPFNLAHGIQMLFSVHNFYFPDPAKTMQGNLVHSSPILMLLGTLALLHPAEFWSDKRIARGLALSAAMAYVMPSMLAGMDHFYMETCVLLLALASMPVLSRYPLLVPVTLATFHFQWLYFFLAYREHFIPNAVFFAAPVIIDAMFAGYCLSRPGVVKKIANPVRWLRNAITQP